MNAATTHHSTVATAAARQLSEEEARIAKRYNAQDEIPHILAEPDMYLGDNLQPSTVDRWMLASDDDAGLAAASSLSTSKLVRRPCLMVHGVLKLIDEILVNSRDQAVRMALAIQDWKDAAAKTKKDKDAAAPPAKASQCPFRPVTRISVRVDDATGSISVENDGSGIEVAMHPIKQKWVPELIFTTLRAGENGAKSKKSTVGGKNGHGAKLALVWSTSSVIETVDDVRQLRYRQHFGANLSHIGEPEVAKVAKTVKPYTRVQFTPDYARANMPLGVRTPDFLALVRKRVLDLAAVACCNKVQVFFNDVLVPIADLSQYVARFPLARPPCVGEVEEEEEKEEHAAPADVPDEDDMLIWCSDELFGDEEADAAAYAEADDVQSRAPTVASTTTASAKKTKIQPPPPLLLPHWVQSFKTKDGRWEVFVGYSASGKREQVSFVNGVCTYQGGTHVDHIVDQITARAIVVVEKSTKMKLKPATIANQLQVFVRADICKPSFNGQAKEMLKTPVALFGGTCDLPPRWIDALVAKLGLAEVATARESALDAKQLKKDILGGVSSSTSSASSSSASARKYVLAMQAIDKFQAAPAAGRHNDAAERALTELMLTEGDSAMSGVVSGLLPSQKNHIGIFPLMGKPANVLSHAIKTLVAKTLVAETKGGKCDPLVTVMRILGLEPGMKFTDEASVVRQLHYAHLSIVADQDHDGSHIKGLLLLFLHTVSPSLAKVPGFVRVFNTPVVVVRRGAGKKAGESRSFLTQTAYEHWHAHAPEASERGWESKFYKGLGSSTKSEWQAYMSRRQEFSFEHTGAASDESVSLAFDPKRADDRKRLLTDMAAAAAHELDLSRSAIPVEEFIADMVRTYSNYSNLRALPHVIDGFKPSMRKVWFAARKRNLVKQLKVAQFSGFVSEVSDYHHGDVSLQTTIVGMAQQVAGQNNIALLAACGQFGTRLQNGADAASARYIFTHMSPIGLVLFRPEDDCVLPGIPGSDGGGSSSEIEPPHFVPILPMALVNPASGMGTGWSSTMVCYHPAQLADYVRVHYLGAAPTLGHLYAAAGGVDDLVPFYQGFRGSVERTATETRFLMRGVYSAAVVDGVLLRVDITEVPVMHSYLDYKEYLIELQRQSMDAAAGKPAAAGKKTVRALGKWSLQLVSESANDLTCRFVVEIGGGDNDDDDDYANVARLLVKGADSGVTPLETLLKLTSWIDTTNMSLVEDPTDPQTGLYSEHAVVLPRVHTGPITILERHSEERLALYARRIVVHLAALRQKQTREENMARFLGEVCSGDLDVHRKSRAAMGEMLAARGYAAMGAGGGGVDDAAEDGGNGGGYAYLLSVRMYQISVENVARQLRLAEATRASADAYAKETPRSLWLKELAEFDVSYEAYLVALAESQQEGGGNCDDAAAGDSSSSSSVVNVVAVQQKKRKAAAPKPKKKVGEVDQQKKKKQKK